MKIEISYLDNFVLKTYIDGNSFEVRFRFYIEIGNTSDLVKHGTADSYTQKP